MGKVSPTALTDDDFFTFSHQLRQKMDHLDGRAWQDAQDLRDECRRGRLYNSLTARIRVATALNARHVKGHAER